MLTYRQYGEKVRIIMKLKETEWKSVRLDDRTILKKDLSIMSKQQIEALGEIEVVKIGNKRYKAINV